MIALAATKLAAPNPTADEDNPVVRAAVWIGSHFIGLFNEAGKQFTGLVTGILPTLIVLLTFMYALVSFIGEKRVTRAVQWSSRWWITRYSVMPVLAVLMLTNPMCYSFGRFLPERYKPAFYDSSVSFVHPVTTFFPYANSGELFVWLGIASGVQKLGESTVPLALYYLFTGVVVIFIRGVVTERITHILIKRTGRTEIFRKFDEEFSAAGTSATAMSAGGAR